MEPFQSHPMDPEIKGRWLDALRSGNYRQAKSVLHQVDSTGREAFCCLGVLCDLAFKDGAVKRTREVTVDEDNADLYGEDETYTREEFYYHDPATGFGSSAFLPASVREWAGVDDSSGSYGVGRMLTYHNDTQDMSFKEIADIIEANF